MQQGIDKLLKNNRLFEQALLLFALTLPLWRVVNIWSLWFLGLTWLLLPWQEKKENYERHKTALLLILSIFVAYLYLSFANCPEYCDFKQPGQMAGLVLLPLFILTVDKKRLSYPKIFKALGAGLITGIIISWSVVLWTIYQRPFPFFHELQYFFQWIYTGENLLKPLDLHPSYFAILLVIFISTLIYADFFKKFRQKSFAFYGLLFILLFFLAETNSRIAIISLLIILLVQSIRHFNRTNLIILTGAFIIVLIAGFEFSFLQKKIQLLLAGEERIFRWQAISEVFFKQPMWYLGLGEHQATQVYLEAYKNGGFSLALKNSYNAHNQYLELLFKAGILGLLSFVGTLIYFVKRTRLKKESLFFFISIILFAGVESILQRNKGIFIFAFFYSIFIRNFDTDEKR